MDHCRTRNRASLPGWCGGPLPFPPLTGRLPRATPWARFLAPFKRKRVGASDSCPKGRKNLAQAEGENCDGPDDNDFGIDDGGVSAGGVGPAKDRRAGGRRCSLRPPRDLVEPAVRAHPVRLL